MAQDASEEVSSIGRWNFFYCKLRVLNAAYGQVKPEKSAILMIPKGRNLGFDSECHGECPLQPEIQGVSIIVTTARRANKGDSGTRDAPAKPERAL